MTGAELQLIENPQERWQFVREKAATDRWVSATNVLVPPTGSEPFGVDGYKTLGYELAEDVAVAESDAILVPTARGDVLWGIYKGFQDLLADRCAACQNSLPSSHSQGLSMCSLAVTFAANILAARH